MSTADSQSPRTLDHQIVSFWGLVSQSLAGMAPTCDVVAFMTAGAAFALVALPLSYLAAFALMFIEVNTIYHLSKDRPSAGGYYSYVSMGLGPRAATLTGFMVLFYQILSVAAVPVYIGGVFLPGLALELHIDLPSYFWILMVAMFIGVPWGLSVTGIRPSIKVLTLTSLTEILFLIVTSIWIIGRVHPAVPMRPFALASTGVRGLAMGMIFAITSFIGVGSHAPLGEETKGVRTQRGRLVGKAAIVSLTLVGAALVLSAYALTVGWGIMSMKTFAQAPAPGVTVFLHYLGPVGAVALVVLALNSAMADDIALLTSSSRVLYAIARDQLVNTGFAQVNGHNAPAKSVSLLAGIAFVVAVSFGVWLGPSKAFNMLTTAVLFGLVTAHTLMNVSLMRLFHDDKSHKRHVFQHMVLPVVATGLFWWVLYESVWPIIWPISLSALLWLAFLIPVLWYIKGKSHLFTKENSRNLGMVDEVDTSF